MPSSPRSTAFPQGMLVRDLNPPPLGRRLVLWGLLGALAGSCGLFVPGTTAEAVAMGGHGRVDLFRLDGTLHTVRQRYEGTLLFQEDFRLGPGAWEPWIRPGLSLGDWGSGRDAAPFAGEGIEWSGGPGGFATLVPVPPRATLRLSAELWFDDEGVPAPAPALQATELRGWPRASALVLERVAAFAGRRRGVDVDAAQPRRWQALELTLQSGPETNALLLDCIAGGAERVRFRNLELELVPPRAHWEQHLRRSTRATSAEQDPAGGSRFPARFPARIPATEVGQRRTRVGESRRPALVLLPGERLRFDLTVPADARLRTSLVDWLEVARMAGPEVEAGTLEVFVQDVPVARSRAARDGARTDQDVDLSAWAGRSVALTFTCSGERPVALLDPLVESSPDTASRAGDEPRR